MSNSPSRSRGAFSAPGVLGSSLEHALNERGCNLPSTDTVRSQIVVTQQGTATGHFSTCSYLTGYSVRLLLRKRVLHHCTHLGAKTCGRIQFDRCCLVTRLHKVKKFAPNFDVYVQRLDWPTGLQHPHRGRDCRRRARLPKVVICERKNNGSELDA